MSTPVVPERRLGPALVVNSCVLAVMWFLELVDQLTRNSLDQFGITPRDPSDLWSIITAPWMHFGWAHLVSNSVPLLVLGVLIYLSGRGQWIITFLVTTLVSGLMVWLLSPSMTNTAGASGIVFGFLTYLLVRGFFTRKLGQIAVAVLVMLLYGGVLWGVLPTDSGVSWQAHLGGAIGGVASAWLLHARRARSHRAQPYSAQY